MLSKQVAKQVFKYLSKANDDAPIEVIFPNGEVYQSANGKPKATVIFKSNSSLRKAIFLDQIGFIAGYAKGSIDIEGDNALSVLINFANNANK